MRSRPGHDVDEVTVEPRSPHRSIGIPEVSRLIVFAVPILRDTYLTAIDVPKLGDLSAEIPHLLDTTGIEYKDVFHDWFGEVPEAITRRIWRIEQRLDLGLQ